MSLEFCCIRLVPHACETVALGGRPISDSGYRVVECHSAPAELRECNLNRLSVMDNGIGYSMADRVKALVPQRLKSFVKKAVTWA